MLCVTTTGENLSRHEVETTIKARCSEWRHFSKNLNGVNNTHTQGGATDDAQIMRDSDYRLVVLQSNRLHMMHPVLFLLVLRSSKRLVDRVDTRKLALSDILYYDVGMFTQLHSDI